MFFSKDRSNERYYDNIYPIIDACKKDSDPNKINGTVGSLYGEDEKIITYKTVFNCFRNLSNETMASYASGSFGNVEFNKAISKFALENKINNYRLIPSPGGTGAVYLGFNISLSKGDTILIPETAWENYSNMAHEKGLIPIYYDIYDLDELFKKLESLEKIFLVINSPCQNPCGHSYKYDEWKRIIDYLNNCDKEAIILNDVAYIEYGFDEDKKKYFELFNNLNDNVLVLIAYSCSKSFSYYGFRLGALFVVGKNNDILDLYINQCAKKTRTTYSSVNNGAMHSIIDLVNNHLDEYHKEKEEYQKLLKERVELFLKEADENNLVYFPYDSGFFVTLKFENNEIRDDIFNLFKAEHLYFIKVYRGIRIGLCSIPVRKIKGLAKRLKDIMSTYNK